MARAEVPVPHLFCTVNMQRALVLLILRFWAHEQGKQRDRPGKGLGSMSCSSFSPAIRSVQVFCSTRVIPTASSCFQKCEFPRMWSLSSCCSHRLLLGMGHSHSLLLCASPAPFLLSSIPVWVYAVTLGKVVFSYLAWNAAAGTRQTKSHLSHHLFFLKTAPHRMWAINCKQTNEIVMIPFLAPWEDTEESRMG